ncbi:hypothetical protein D9M69_692060 [compost metagenome]
MQSTLGWSAVMLCLVHSRQQLAVDFPLAARIEHADYSAHDVIAFLNFVFVAHSLSYNCI